jgi:predicted dehydrogenase
MRLGLIGSTGHWQTYAPALQQVHGLTLAAVAAAGPEETLGAFDHAPGLTVETHRYEDAQKMLESERLDLVQVSARCDRIPQWTLRCLERGIPVMAEKPLAMDLPTLGELFVLARRKRTPLMPMHTMRGVPALAVVRQAVQGGAIGQPMLSFSQKSYKWGNDRPDYYRSRRTFPGLAPWVGIHAFDWLHWILGDVFISIQGIEGATVHPEFPACASHAAFLLNTKNGGIATITLDYLRTETAPTHGDERLRIAGKRGVIDTALVERKVILIADNRAPQALGLTPQPDLFTRFVRSLRGEGTPPLTLQEGCRITEIALKAQQAAESRQIVSLQDSPFRA